MRIQPMYVCARNIRTVAGRFWCSLNYHLKFRKCLPEGLCITFFKIPTLSG